MKSRSRRPSRRSRPGTASGAPAAGGPTSNAQAQDLLRSLGGDSGASVHGQGAAPGAAATARGSDIYLGEAFGALDPAMQELVMAHELAHVQQAGAPGVTPRGQVEADADQASAALVAGQGLQTSVGADPAASYNFELPQWVIDAADATSGFVDATGEVIDEGYDEYLAPTVDANVELGRMLLEEPDEVYNGLADIGEPIVADNVEFARMLVEEPDEVYSGLADLGEPIVADNAEFLEMVTDDPSGTAEAGYPWGTRWHFEGREERNGEQPTYEEMMAPDSDWVLLPESMSIYHDDGEGAAELKFIHPDGREAVVNGDSYAVRMTRGADASGDLPDEEVTDPRYMPTYNYVAPMSTEDVENPGDAVMFAGRGAGHFLLDVIPYYLGGNVRGEN